MILFCPHLLHEAPCRIVILFVVYAKDIYKLKAFLIAFQIIWLKIVLIYLALKSLMHEQTQVSEIGDRRTCLQSSNVRSPDTASARQAHWTTQNGSAANRVGRSISANFIAVRLTAIHVCGMEEMIHAVARPHKPQVGKPFSHMQECCVHRMIPQIRDTDARCGHLYGWCGARRYGPAQRRRWCGAFPGGCHR